MTDKNVMDFIIDNVISEEREKERKKKEVERKDKGLVELDVVEKHKKFPPFNENDVAIIVFRSYLGISKMRILPLNHPRKDFRKIPMKYFNDVSYSIETISGKTITDYMQTICNDIAVNAIGDSTLESPRSPSTSEEKMEEEFKKIAKGTKDAILQGNKEIESKVEMSENNKLLAKEVSESSKKNLEGSDKKETTSKDIMDRDDNKIAKIFDGLVKKINATKKDTLPRNKDGEIEVYIELEPEEEKKVEEDTDKGKEDDKWNKW